MPVRFGVSVAVPCQDREPAHTAFLKGDLKGRRVSDPQRLPGTIFRRQVNLPLHREAK
jgi:hypothetical protein